MGEGLSAVLDEAELVFAFVFLGGDEVDEEVYVLKTVLSSNQSRVTFIESDLFLQPLMRVFGQIRRIRDDDIARFY